MILDSDTSDFLPLIVHDVCNTVGITQLFATRALTAVKFQGIKQDCHENVTRSGRVLHEKSMAKEN